MGIKVINDKCPDCSSSLPDSALGMALLRDAESKTLHAPFSMTSGEQSDLHTTWHLKSALLSGDQCGVVQSGFGPDGRKLGEKDNSSENDIASALLQLC